MIKVSSFPKLYAYMSTFLYYGVSHQYSFEYIEERISKSVFANELEQSRDSFLFEKNVMTLLQEIYELDNIDISSISESNSLFLWLGEAYIRLFFKFHKSIFYIFLYLPLKAMIGLYDLYHEQDWGQLYRYFIEVTERTSLLKMLVKKRGLSINKLSIITGISQNTLNYYVSDDRHLYEAKYAYVDSLAYALDVDARSFLPKVHNYLDTSDYGFEQNNEEFRGYLALYIVSYFANDIKQRGYRYDKKKNAFVYPGGELITRNTEVTGYNEETNVANPEVEKVVMDLANSVNPEERKTTVLVIFEHNMISTSSKVYASLNKYGFERLYIINKAHIICIKDDYWISYLSKNVDDLLKEKTKAFLGDFAL